MGWVISSWCIIGALTWVGSQSIPYWLGAASMGGLGWLQSSFFKFSGQIPPCRNALLDGILSIVSVSVHYLAPMWCG